MGEEFLRVLALRRRGEAPAVFLVNIYLREECVPEYREFSMILIPLALKNRDCSFIA